MSDLQNSHIHILKKDLFIVIGFLIIGAILGYVLATTQTKSKQTITVLGEASQTVKADKLVMSFTTSEQGTTAASAKAKNEKVVNEIKAKVKKLGINEHLLQVIESHIVITYGPVSNQATRAIPTAAPAFGFSCIGVCPDGDSTVGSQSSSLENSVVESYESITKIKITLEKDLLAKESDIIMLLANYDISATTLYGLTDKESVELQNKENAINNARVQANALAQRTNAKIKKMVGIKEIFPEDKLTYMGFSADAGVNSYTDEIPVMSKFEVTYELAPTFFIF